MQYFCSFCWSVCPLALTAENLTCRQSRWSACTLTGRPLAGEVVADYLGSLYLYEAVLEFLLARAGLSVNDESQVRVTSCCNHAIRTSLLACSLSVQDVVA